MKRRTKIVCVLFLTVILGIGALTVWQWNNICAAFSFVRFSQEELEDKINENDQKIKDAVGTVPEVAIRDITQEEKDALRDGTLTQEELIENLVKPKQESKPPDKPKEESKPSDSPKPEEKPEQLPNQSAQEELTEQRDYEKELASIIAEVYVLREEFLIKLDNLMAEAKAKYLSMPSEQRTTANLMSLASGYLSQGQVLEKECDAKIDEILDRLETLLKENNGDMSIPQTVYDTYVNEKSLKKAWYMAELKKRGLV